MSEPGSRVECEDFSDDGFCCVQADSCANDCDGLTRINLYYYCCECCPCLPCSVCDKESTLPLRNPENPYG